MKIWNKHKKTIKSFRQKKPCPYTMDRIYSEHVVLNKLLKSSVWQTSFFSKFLVISEKNTGSVIKFNYEYNEKDFHFWLWKLFFSNDQIVEIFRILKSEVVIRNVNYKSLMWFRGWLHETNWFAFGSTRWSKNESGLKILFSLHDEKTAPTINETGY